MLTPLRQHFGARRAEQEQLDLEIGADMAVGGEHQHLSGREPLDDLDAPMLHGVLKRVADVLDDEGALQLDHRLLDLGVHPAHHAGQELSAE